MSSNENNYCFHCNKSILLGAKFCPHCGKKQSQFTHDEIKKDPYEALQVSKNAESEVITAAFKGLARKYHPDVNKSQMANEKMREINWAYEILSDPEKRAKWDKVQKYKTKPQKTKSTVPVKDPQKGPISSDPVKEKPKTHASSNKALTCPNCGKDNPPNRLLCIHCSWSLRTKSEGKTQKTGKVEGSVRKGVVVTGAILMVVACFMLIIPQLETNNNKSAGSARIATSTMTKAKTATPRLTRNPKPTNTPQQSSTIKLPYHETFSHPSTIWWTGNDKYGSNKIENGEFIITPKTAEDFGYVVAGANLGNVVVEVTTRFQYIYPYPDSGFVILFRCKNRVSYLCYEMVVNDQGAVYVYKRTSTTNEPILLSYKELNANVKTFNHPNHWIIMMDGAHFEIYCNDIFVTSFDDSSYKSGDIGLGVYASPDNEFIRGVSFDDIKIYRAP